MLLGLLLEIPFRVQSTLFPLLDVRCELSNSALLVVEKFVQFRNVCIVLVARFKEFAPQLLITVLLTCVSTTQAAGVLTSLAT